MELKGSLLCFQERWLGTARVVVDGVFL